MESYFRSEALPFTKSSWWREMIEAVRLFHQSARAIVLGLAYAMVIENLVFGLLPRSVKPIHDLFPMAGATHLQQSFGDISSVVGITFSSPGAVDVSQAVILLAVWTCGLVVGSALLTRLRDIA
jgi:uncharacterized membrane protein YfcA